MSWGTYINTNIYIDREIYESKEILIDRIEELKDLIQDTEEILMMLVSSDVNKNTSNNEEECYTTENIINIHRDVRDMLNYIKELSINKYKLELLLENFEKRKTY